MKFKNLKILSSFLLLVVSFDAMSDNGITKSLGTFENWSVYAKSKNLCYMIAQPSKSEGDYNVRGRVRIVVYRNNMENKNKNVVGIDFGYSFPENSNVLIKIDNKKNFKLNTFGQTAWTGSKANADRQIIEEMIKGNSLVALGISSRGTNTKDIYSLDGFAKALNKIQNYCS